VVILQVSLSLAAVPSLLWSIRNDPNSWSYNTIYGSKAGNVKAKEKLSLYLTKHYAMKTSLA